MLFLTKLSQDSQNFIASINRRNLGSSLTFSLALARVIGSGIQLPSSPVENQQAYYRENITLEVRRLISTINEIVIIDKAVVEDLTFNFYKARYNALHPSNNIVLVNPDTAIADFFGLSKCFGSNELETIKQHPFLLTELTNSLSNIIKELKTSL